MEKRPVIDADTTARLKAAFGWDPEANYPFIEKDHTATMYNLNRFRGGCLALCVEEANIEWCRYLLDKIKVNPNKYFDFPFEEGRFPSSIRPIEIALRCYGESLSKKADIAEIRKRHAITIMMIEHSKPMPTPVTREFIKFMCDHTRRQMERASDNPQKFSKSTDFINTHQDKKRKTDE